jgi:hypothetical protein
MACRACEPAEVFGLEFGGGHRSFECSALRHAPFLPSYLRTLVFNVMFDPGETSRVQNA